VEAITPMFLGDKAFVANAVMESANCGTKHVMEYTYIRIIEAMFALIRKSISNVLEYNETHNEFEMEQEVLNKYMRKQSVLAIMWGFSGSLKLFERANYSKKIEILIDNSNIEGLGLPKDLIEYCLIDYECRIDDGEWNLWKNKVPTVDIDP
jgi:dynein heavy chain 1